MTEIQLRSVSATQQACDSLDREDFAEFLTCCAPEFRYRITAYSPDLRKELLLMDQEKSELVTLFETLPNHIRMPGQLLRHLASSHAIPMDEQGSSATKVITAVAVYYTDLDGTTRLYAVGKYHDVVIEQSNRSLLQSRTLRLDTRDLSPGCHVPL